MVTQSVSGVQADEAPVRGSSGVEANSALNVALSARAHFQQGRLRIPVGNGGFVTLPEMVGIGDIKCWVHAELQSKQWR